MKSLISLVVAVTAGIPTAWANPTVIGQTEAFPMLTWNRIEAGRSWSDRGVWRTDSDRVVVPCQLPPGGREMPVEYYAFAGKIWCFTTDGQLDRIQHFVPGDCETLRAGD